MDRVMLAKSSSPPPTPAASSAGASSPAVPVNIGSADRSGLGQGPKGGSLSGAGSWLPWNSVSTSAGESALGSSQLSCRPWERADLLKRLATFKPANWSGKPKVASSLACARRGWINVDVDAIACEACGANISFVIHSFWTCDEERQFNNGIAREHEAAEFDPIQQHHHFCPWVNGNVAAAGCSSGSISMALCGWQLTLDALEAYGAQGHIPAVTMESESAASLYKDDQLASVHKLLGRHSMTKNRGHS